MDRRDIAETIANQIISGNVRYERGYLLSDPQFGFYTQKMLKIELYVPLASLDHTDTWAEAQSLFSKAEDKTLKSGGLRNQSKELELDVYFPLPYKSAERLPESERREFIINMALFKISEALYVHLSYKDRALLIEKITDPRHPDEIKWERRRNAFISFFKGLVPERKQKTERTYQEYL